MKIGVTVARFQAPGNTPVVIDRLNRCVIEGKMIGAHSRRTRLVVRGCAVALEMRRCWRVRRTVNSRMGRKSKIGCFSRRGNGEPFRCSGGAVEVHWLAKYLANRVAFSKSVVATSSSARRSGMARCGVEIFANCFASVHHRWLPSVAEAISSCLR